MGQAYVFITEKKHNVLIVAGLVFVFIIGKNKPVKIVLVQVCVFIIGKNKAVKIVEVVKYANIINKKHVVKNVVLNIAHYAILHQGKAHINNIPNQKNTFTISSTVKHKPFGNDFFIIKNYSKMP